MIVVHWQIVLPYSQFFARYMHCWKLSVPLMCADWNPSKINLLGGNLF
jgi:hypothetical protein